MTKTGAPELGDKTLTINLTTVLTGRKVTLGDLDRAAAAAAAAVRATLEGTRRPYEVAPIQVSRAYGYAFWVAETQG